MCPHPRVLKAIRMAADRVNAQIATTATEILGPLMSTDDFAAKANETIRKLNQEHRSRSPFEHEPTTTTRQSDAVLQAVAQFRAACAIADQSITLHGTSNSVREITDVVATANALAAAAEVLAIANRR